jgi:hypothetical protein
MRRLRQLSRRLHHGSHLPGRGRKVGGEPGRVRGMQYLLPGLAQRGVSAMVCENHGKGNVGSNATYDSDNNSTLSKEEGILHGGEASFAHIALAAAWTWTRGAGKPRSNPSTLKSSSISGQ